MKQVCNLRNDCPHIFADSSGEIDWETKCDRQRTQMAAKGIQFAVAPGCQLYTPDGRHLTEGMAVTVRDFANVLMRHPSGVGTYEKSPLAQLQEHLRTGQVIEADINPPRAA